MKQLFPAAVVNQPEDSRAGSCCKTAVDCCVCRKGSGTREQVSAGMRHARASESPFWPSPAIHQVV
ncbi:hypothetical protein DMI70_19185 [Escherichia coli]|nr:hypothetical protein [Escherichia coli]